MADLNTSAANSLCNNIVMLLMKYGAEPQTAKSQVYLLLRDYQITEKTMELTEYHGNKTDELIRRFIIAKTTAGLAPRTLKLYYIELRNVMFKIGRDVGQITADDIRYYIAQRMREGVTKTTINNERRYMSSFFTWLTAEELISRNPMLQIEAIKQVKEKKSAFSDEDIERMRTVLRSWREKAIFETLLSTGCRVSELVSIKIADIEDGESVYILGKGSKYRNVYLNAKAKIAIEKYLEERSDKNPFLFPRAIPNFVASACVSGKAKTHEWYKNPELVDAELHTDGGTVETIIRNIGKRAGVANAHPHRFRRTCATSALKRGMPLELVSKMLGHDSVGTTQIYLDLNEDDLRVAHRKYVT